MIEFTWNGAKHGKILEGHLAGSVLADGHTTVRAGKVKVGLRNGAHADLKI